MTTHKSLAQARLAAQAEMDNATINATNPHFRNKYANLEAVRAAVIPPMTNAGIVVSQVTGYDDNGRLVLKTVFTHAATGESEESALPIPDSGKMQDIGSAITYARRYTLSSLAGIASEEDDDGNSAGTVNKPAAKKQPPKQEQDPAAAKAMQIKNEMAKAESVNDVSKVWQDNAEHISSMPKNYQGQLEKYRDEYLDAFTLDAAE